MDRRRPFLMLSAIAVCGSLLAAPVDRASAAERWASPTSLDITGTCEQTAPCRIEWAFDGAGAGDHVVLRPGDYTLTKALVTTNAITVRGVPGADYPKLAWLGTTGPALALDGGGAARHLVLGASGADIAALRASGALVEDVAVFSTLGPALDVRASATARTLVRDGVFVTRSISAATAAVVLQDGGDVALRNIDAWSGFGADGVDCAITSGAATLVNVVVRGTAVDVDATGNTARCSATFSNLRAGASPGLALGAGIQSGEPLFVDPAAGDWRQRPGSPTIDAGTDDPLLGEHDPDGRNRRIGTAPDIGAYEFLGADPAQGDRHTPVLPPQAILTPFVAPLPTAGAEEPPAPPKMGRSVVVSAGTGVVRIRKPGSTEYVPLDDAENIPVGATVDARKGAVTLTSALPGARDQTGTFSGGMFTIRQSEDGRGMTDLYLRGGDPSVCRRARRPSSRGAVARAADARRKRRGSRTRVIRRLWGRDKGGRFRTHGQNSVATVRGTRWLTEDRCDGTRTKVTSGAVDVRALRGRKRVRRVRAGQSFLVRARSR